MKLTEAQRAILIPLAEELARAALRYNAVQTMNISFRTPEELVRLDVDSRLAALELELSTKAYDEAASAITRGSSSLTSIR